MRKIAIAGALVVLVAAAAPSATPRPEAGALVKARLTRLHAAADRALAAEPLERAEELPAPLSWALMLFGFGTLGALLRDRRHAGGEGTFETLPFQ